MRLLILLLFSINASAASQYDTAFKTSCKILYKDSLIDMKLNEMTMRFEHMMTPGQKEYGGYTMFLVKLVMDKQISFTYRFP